MSAKIVICLLLTIATTASAESNDPRTGGFFGGVGGIFSGSYDSRIQERKDNLNRQETINRELKEKSVRFESEAKAREVELASEQQHLNNIEEDLADVESDINQMNTKSAKQKADIAAIKNKITDQRRRIKAQKAALKKLEQVGANDAERLRVIKEERNLLAEEAKKLLEYSQTLSNATK